MERIAKIHGSMADRAPLTLALVSRAQRSALAVRCRPGTVATIDCCGGPASAVHRISAVTRVFDALWRCTACGTHSRLAGMERIAKIHGSMADRAPLTLALVSRAQRSALAVRCRPGTVATIDCCGGPASAVHRISAVTRVFDALWRCTACGTHSRLAGMERIAKIHGSMADRAPLTLALVSRAQRSALAVRCRPGTVATIDCCGGPASAVHRISAVTRVFDALWRCTACGTHSRLAGMERIAKIHGSMADRAPLTLALVSRAQRSALAVRCRPGTVATIDCCGGPASAVHRISAVTRVFDALWRCTACGTHSRLAGMERIAKIHGSMADRAPLTLALVSRAQRSALAVRCRPGTVATIDCCGGPASAVHRISAVTRVFDALWRCTACGTHSRLAGMERIAKIHGSMADRAPLTLALVSRAQRSALAVRCRPGTVATIDCCGGPASAVHRISAVT